MTIFSGLRGYLFMKREKIPSYFFTDWLREKWIADLKLIAWCLAMLPFVIVWAAGGLLAVAGGILLATRDVMPAWIFKPLDKLRDRQYITADAARLFVNIRNKNPAK